MPKLRVTCSMFECTFNNNGYCGRKELHITGKQICDMFKPNVFERDRIETIKELKATLHEAKQGAVETTSKVLTPHRPLPPQ